jgi:hypothetical protein
MADTQAPVTIVGTVDRVPKLPLHEFLGSAAAFVLVHFNHQMRSLLMVDTTVLKLLISIAPDL